MIEFEKVNPNGGVTAAVSHQPRVSPRTISLQSLLFKDRTALNDRYNEVYKATQKHYKLLEETKKAGTEGVDSNEPFENQEYTDLGRPKRKAAKDHHWDWSLNLDDDEDYQPGPAHESGKRKKTQAEDINKTNDDLPNPFEPKEFPAYSQQAAPFPQPGPSHRMTPVPVPVPVPVPNAGFTAVNQNGTLPSQNIPFPPNTFAAINQERTLPGQNMPFPTNTFAAVNQERAAPSAAASASSVPGKQTSSRFMEYYNSMFPQFAVGGPGQNNANDSEIDDLLDSVLEQPPNGGDKDNGQNVPSATPAPRGRCGLGRGGGVHTLPKSGLPKSGFEKQNEAQGSFVAPVADMGRDRVPRRNTAAAPVADMGRVNTPVRNTAFPDVFATPAIPATPRAAVPALAAGVLANITKLAEEVARQTAAREDAVRQLGEAVFEAIATRGPGGVRLQDSEVVDMLQLLRQANQQ